MKKISILTLAVIFAFSANLFAEEVVQEKEEVQVNSTITERAAKEQKVEQVSVQKDGEEEMIEVIKETTTTKEIHKVPKKDLLKSYREKVAPKSEPVQVAPVKQIVKKEQKPKKASKKIIPKKLPQKTLAQQNAEKSKGKFTTEPIVISGSQAKKPHNQHLQISMRY